MAEEPCPYHIELTDDEVRTLVWMATHGYFPMETYAALQCETDDSHQDPKLYSLQEHDAWPICDLMEEDPEACFACATPSLRDKLMTLWESIV